MSSKGGGWPGPSNAAGLRNALAVTDVATIILRGVGTVSDASDVGVSA
jgi:hypothetical protein